MWEGQVVTSGARHNDPVAQFWDVLRDVRVGMLGIARSTGGMQPIIPLPDPDRCVIRFVTSRDSDLVRAVGIGKRALFSIGSDDLGYHACTGGRLTRIPEEDAGAIFEARAEQAILELELTDGTAWIATRRSSTEPLPDAVRDVGRKVYLNFVARKAPPSSSDLKLPYYTASTRPRTYPIARAAEAGPSGS